MREARHVFDDWALTNRAEGMEKSHRPFVESTLASLNAVGDYLEVGIGSGYAIEAMAMGPFKDQQCLGVEWSEQMCSRALTRLENLSNVEIINADFLTWDPADRRFGCIFSMEVFYYFESIQKGLKKSCDLLIPGGELVVAVDFYHEHEASRQWPLSTKTPMELWTMANYIGGFEKAGFTEIRQAVVVPEGHELKAGEAGALITRGLKPAS